MEDIQSMQENKGMKKGKKKNFLKQFLKDRQMVGAINPSTRFLGEKMIEDVDFKTSKLIVELGPGTGVFTDLILENMADDAKLLVFELNDHFYELLKERIKDPRAQIIHDSAEHIENHLSETEKENVDVIISSLPLTVFPDQLRKAVVNNAHASLKDNGVYKQFQYSLQAKKLLESTYGNVSIKFTLKNFPPAFVYTCLKA